MQGSHLLACWLAIIAIATANSPITLHGHIKRGLPGFPGQGGEASQSVSTAPPPNPSAPINSSCVPLPLTPETWIKLNLDQHLRDYPGGQNLTVIEYATVHGMPNFDCGIGIDCHAGNPCYPASMPDWYVLFAIQQWNLQRNAMLKAISFAINFVQSTITFILAALFPSVDTMMVDLFKTSMSVNGGAMLVANTLLLDIFALFNSFQYGWNMFFNILNNIAGAAMYGAAGFIHVPQSHPNDAFTQWSHLVDDMAHYEQYIINAFANETQAILTAGISSPNGIANDLRNGSFIKPIEPIYLPIVEEDLKNVTTALAVAQILRAMDSFVTIGAEECHGKGKNGAREGRDVLSYCDPQGTMFNIVRIYKNKEEKKFPNAYQIENQFGFSTQFLTNASISCQERHNTYGYSPYNTTLLPKDPSADCVINLPVCDVRDHKIRKTKKKHGVVRACREAGLPI